MDTVQARKIPVRIATTAGRSRTSSLTAPKTVFLPSTQLERRSPESAPSWRTKSDHSASASRNQADRRGSRLTNASSGDHRAVPARNTSPTTTDIPTLAR